MARVIDGSDSVVVPKSFRATSRSLIPLILAQVLKTGTDATMLKQIIQTNTATE